MKIKLTPELSYLAGVTKYSRIKKGIGVRGPQQLQEAFVKGALDAGIASADKFIVKDAGLLFFHSAYEAYLGRVQEEAVDKFKHLNDYAAAYLAGLFDSVGGIADGSVYLYKFDRQDEAILDNLGFESKVSAGRVYIGHHEQFLRFIKKWAKIE
ncbi:MAG: hypothetical protein V1822_01830, partial [Candidatus Micrarchaeota archaeon]